MLYLIGNYQTSMSPHCTEKQRFTRRQESDGSPVDLLVILRSWRMDARLDEVGLTDESSQPAPFCFQFCYLRLHCFSVFDTSLFITVVVLSSVLVRQRYYMDVAGFFVCRHPRT